MPHVTVPDEPTRVQFVVTTADDGPFAFAFSYFDVNDVEVYNGSSLIDAADYTLTPVVSATGGYEGGSITLDTPVSNTTITVIRNVPIARETDFPTSGRFPIDTLNSWLDKTYAILQQLATKLTRTIRTADTDTSVSLVLPAAASRANKALIFTSTGAVDVSTDDYEDQAVAAAASAVAANLSASNASTSANNSAANATLALNYSNSALNYSNAANASAVAANASAAAAANYSATAGRGISVSGSAVSISGVTENVATAATLNLASFNSTTINLTGSTNISAISNGANVPPITAIVGNGTPTLVHNVSALTIQGAANYTTATGDKLQIVPTGNTTATIFIERANGTPVVAGASGAMTLINQTIVSTNVASVAFTNFSMESYKGLMLQIVGVEPTTTGNVLLRVSDNNGSSYYSSSYDSDSMWNNGTTVTADSASNGFILNGGGGVYQPGHGLFCTAFIRPNATGQKLSINFMAHQYDAAAGNQTTVSGGGVENNNSSQAKNAIQIIAASGNLRRATSTNGTITLWGVN